MHFWKIAEIFATALMAKGHKILRNLHLTFDYSTYIQKLGEDFSKFCGLLRIYELYLGYTTLGVSMKGSFDHVQ